MFLERVIILDNAIAQLAAERLNNQPVLFRDCSVKLEEQLQFAEELSGHFNPLARAVDAAEINLEELRNSLQLETDRQISIWVHLARTEALSTFGTEKEVQAAMEQSLHLVKSNCGEASDRDQPSSEPCTSRNS
jgi:3'-phosphoadenosine 5'-phosphosulfate sulfotransferase (PAPS reductase)/FAD synthetase